MIDRDTVIPIAEEAGFVFVGDLSGAGRLPALLERFAKLIEQKAASAEREACARINTEKSERLGQEAESALEEGDRDTCTSNRAAAHLLSVCAARIRARGTGGEG